MMLLAPSLVVMTLMATLAARNATLVRGWHDAREANAWLASMLAAAIASAAGVVLLDVSASFVAERTGLGAVATEWPDPSQRGRIILEMVHARHDAMMCTCADGVLAVATVAPALLGAFGRGPDGRRRTPFGPPPFVALAGVIAMVAAGLGVRAWTFGGLERIATQGAATGAIVLPLEPAGAYERSEGHHPGITAYRDGRIVVDGELEPLLNTITITADGGARWADVGRSIRAMIVARDAATRPPFGLRRELPSLSIRVAPRSSRTPETERLGAYALFVGEKTPAVRVALEKQPYRSKDQVVVGDVPAGADMDFVVQQIARRSALNHRA